MEEEEASSSKDRGALSPENMAKYTQDVLKKVVAATRAAKALPKLGEDYELYNSYPVFAELMKVEGDRVLQLINKLCKHAGAKTQLNTLLADERMERLGEINDFLLERVGILLDEAAGLRRPEELVVVGPDSTGPLARTIATSWNRVLHNRQKSAAGDQEESSTSTSGEGRAKTGTPNKPMRLLGSFNVPKPQLEFAEQIDNSNKPFVPKLRSKHNAMARKQRDGLRIVDDEDDAQSGVPGSAMDVDVERSPHPYKYELDHFEPQPWQLEYSEVIPAKPVTETPLTMVHTEAQLEDLCRTLKSVREFAVDLEHHSYRSFQGVTCLIQISTRTHDYIIDPFGVWRSMHILNDPFTDPSIMKIFHAANMDVAWLQRDFGIYVVNMFDTGQAVRMLNYARLSLAFLVQHCCGVELEKQYQLADWRIRPLPEEMVKYARLDTHYLLMCCDLLRRELIDKGNERKNLLRAVFTSSRDVSLKVYHKPLYDPDDHLTLLGKAKKRFNSRQLYALKHLFEWRDNLARQEDESLHYVLPDHMLLQIAEVLPRELQGIWACCSPVPPLLRQDSHTLHRMILHARSLPLESKEVRPVQLDIAGQNSKNVNGVGLQSMNEIRSSLLKCLDFSHSPHDEEIAPLAHRLSTIPNVIRIKEPSLSFGPVERVVGQQPPSKKRKTIKSDLADEVKTAWRELTTPYEQYLASVAAAVEKEQAVRMAEASDGSKSKKRKMYSHMDPLVSKESEPSTSALDQEEPTVETVPPKKKKRKIDDESNLDEVLPAKALKKRKKPKPDLGLTTSYDYSTADKSVFNKGASKQKADVYEPHSEMWNKRDKKKKKANARKGMSGTISGGGGAGGGSGGIGGGVWKKKAAATFSAFDSGGGAKGKKKGGGKR